jgi:hypothetical protein
MALSRTLTNSGSVSGNWDCVRRVLLENDRICDLDAAGHLVGHEGEGSVVVAAHVGQADLGHGCGLGHAELIGGSPQTRVDGGPQRDGLVDVDGLGGLLPEDLRQGLLHVGDPGAAPD